MATTPADEKKYPSLTMQDNYYDATEETKTFDATPDSGVYDLSAMDPEQRAKMEEDWRVELAKTEEEIMTLRQVLSNKLKYSQELKRKLGITAWRELKDDVEQGLKNIQESAALKEVNVKLLEWNNAITSAPIYQKTSQTIKTAGEKTTSALGTFGASVTKKLEEMKNSTAYRSFEEKVGSAYTNVKSRMSNSRSSSTYSFEEALNIYDGRSSGVASPATTPTVPEKKPLS